MNKNRKLFLITFFTITLFTLSCAGNLERIVIHGRGPVYELTVPISHLRLLIPQNRFFIDEHDNDNPRYFQFSNKNKPQIIISGWFENENNYPGIKKLWSDDLEDWPRSFLPEPQNIFFSKIGIWEVVTYDLPISEGTNSHIRAQYVKKGTWIDLHLSITSKKSISENQKILSDVLQRIQIEEKH